jgi:hypothetical protein
MKIQIEASDLYELILSATQPVDMYIDFAEDTKERISEILAKNGLDYLSLQKDFEDRLSLLAKAVRKEMNPPRWKPMLVK